MKYFGKVGAQLSFADKGKPTQNPYSEGFISILSRFWLRQHEFVSTVQVEKSLKKFFKLYNREWLHGEMGYVTPLAKLEDFRKESETNPELISKLLLLTVEDTAHLIFDYDMNGGYDRKTIGNFVISRVYPQKEEKLTVVGTRGIIVVERGRICRLTPDGQEVEKLERASGWPSALLSQVDYFAQRIMIHKEQGIHPPHEHWKHIAIMQAAYDSEKLGVSTKPSDYLSQLSEGEK